MKTPSKTPKTLSEVVNEEQLRILEEHQITNNTKLSLLGNGELADILAITRIQAEKILVKARNNLPLLEIVSGAEILEEELNKKYLSTGSKSVDNLLEGGFVTGATTMLSAPFGCGKSQFALSAAVRVQKNYEEGGLDGSCIYIDTEKTLRVSRILQIAGNIAPEIDKETLLKNIKIIRPNSAEQQILALNALTSEKGITDVVGPLTKNPKLLIVDSITSLFRSSYIGRGTLSERQQHLNSHVANCLKFANKYQAVVILNNQVVAVPDMYSAPYKPAGGHVLSHAVTYSLMLKNNKRARIIEVLDSAHLKNTQAVFSICAAGITDASNEYDD